MLFRYTETKMETRGELHRQSKKSQLRAVALFCSSSLRWILDCNCTAVGKLEMRCQRRGSLFLDRDCSERFLRRKGGTKVSGRRCMSQRSIRSIPTDSTGRATLTSPQVPEVGQDQRLPPVFHALLSCTRVFLKAFCRLERFGD